MSSSLVAAEGNFQTDFERQYRREFDHMIAAGYFPDEAIFDVDKNERYVWEKGRLYQSGYPIVDWQLDQAMHGARQKRREKCFEFCKICRKAGAETVTRAQKEIEIGKPDPREVKGEYPCPDQHCQQMFSYMSQLMRHQEKVHHQEHDWEAFEEFLQEQAPTQKCLYRTKGRYGKQCEKDAIPGKKHCEDPLHEQQILNKIKAGKI